MINEQAAYAFCRESIENIENYEKAVNSKEKYVCHHKNGAPFTGFTKNDLIKMKMYYHRPASELIFVSEAEHMKLHRTGIKMRDETKKKISDSKRGIAPWNKGKTLSEETKQKLSESLRGRKHTQETKNKMSIARQAYLARKNNILELE